MQLFELRFLMNPKTKTICSVIDIVSFPSRKVQLKQL